MINTEQNRRLWPIAVALLVACGVGYSLALLTQRSANPGTTEPVSGGAATQVDALQIPEASLTMMNIEIESVVSGDLGAEIQAPATVTAATNGQAAITARAAGTIIRLNRKLGDEVKRGEVLASIQSREAAAMAAERTIAESKAELARTILKREQSLYEQKVTPRQELEAAQAQLATAEAEAVRAKAAADAAGVASDGHTLALASPIAGRITSASAVMGTYVEAGMELFRVADPRFVLIEAAVPAMDARRIVAGDKAKVTTGAGENLAAVVVSVTPTLSEQTRSAAVTLSLAKGERVPAPGEFVQVRIATAVKDAKGVVVPADAVQSIAGREVVFVRTENGFRLVPVVVGDRSGGRASILSGLQPGDAIATRNAFLLKAEATKGAEEEE